MLTLLDPQMEGLDVVVAFHEVIDNSIRANATHVTFQALRETQDGGPITGLLCRDDGVSCTFGQVAKLCASAPTCLMMPEQRFSNLAC